MIREEMKRFIVYFKNRTFAEYVWAENKRQARQQMSPLAHYTGDTIIKVEEA